MKALDNVYEVLVGGMNTGLSLEQTPRVDVLRRGSRADVWRWCRSPSRPVSLLCDVTGDDASKANVHLSNSGGPRSRDIGVTK